MRIFILFLTAVLSCCFAGVSFAAPPSGSTTTDYISLDKMPAMITPAEGIKNVLKYPETALKDSLEGTVYISVKVEENGNPTECKVNKGVRADLDSAALNYVKNARFTAAESKGKPVAVSVTVPVRFKLEKKPK